MHTTLTTGIDCDGSEIAPLDDDVGCSFKYAHVERGVLGMPLTRSLRELLLTLAACVRACAWMEDNATIQVKSEEMIRELEGKPSAPERCGERKQTAYISGTQRGDLRGQCRAMHHNESIPWKLLVSIKSSMLQILPLYVTSHFKYLGNFLEKIDDAMCMLAPIFVGKNANYFFSRSFSKFTKE